MSDPHGGVGQSFELCRFELCGSRACVWPATLSIVVLQGTKMVEPSFKDLEHAGWSQRAGAYDSWFSHITSQAHEPLLDALGLHLNGNRLLDVCTGTGYLAAAAAKRGAPAEGLDFSRDMVERARTNYPAVSFREGDAELLPYDDQSFGHVVCAFGHLHLANPDQAVAEAFRVLKPGGRYAYASWRAHPDGYFPSVVDAIGRHGTTDVGLPPSPPFFRFGDPQEAERVLREAGFVDVQTRDIDLIWEPTRTEDLVEWIYKCGVRTTMMLERQTPEALEAIHAAIMQGGEARRRNGILRIPFPALIASASRP
jgi:ubiquinone/menaquinone biosynthesis C-methylase UbiE